MSFALFEHRTNEKESEHNKKNTPAEREKLVILRRREKQMEVLLVLSANCGALIDPTGDSEGLPDFQILEEDLFGTREVLTIE